jgi:hypothetical protein
MTNSAADVFAPLLAHSETFREKKIYDQCLCGWEHWNLVIRPTWTLGEMRVKSSRNMLWLRNS